MSNWNHLPQVGVLVLSAVLAAGAYSVYTGQPGNSSRAGESAADLTLQSPTTAIPAAKARDRGHERRHEARAQEPARLLPESTVSRPASSAPAVMPAPRQGPTTPPLQTAPRSDSGGEGVRDETGRDRELIDQERLGDDELGQELQDIGRGDPTTSEPDTPEPAPGAPPADEPVDVPTDPGATPPVDPETSPPATQPDPSAGADPDSGLDDTPAGGLDQTDLGTPVDVSPDDGAATGTAPAADQAP